MSCNNTKENFSGESEKMSVTFHKNCENTGKILKNSCVRLSHFMNFFFLELNINTHSFDLASWPKRSSKVSWSQLSDFSRTFSITEREMCTKKLTLISWKAYRLIYYSDLRPRWLGISLTSEKNSAVWLVQGHPTRIKFKTT